MARAKKEPVTIPCTYVAHTPCHFNYEGVEYNLVKGVGYELPDCDFVRSLIAQARLEKLK